jgi:hypothetical protein
MERTLAGVLLSLEGMGSAGSSERSLDKVRLLDFLVLGVLEVSSVRSFDMVRERGRLAVGGFAGSSFVMSLDGVLPRVFRAVPFEAGVPSVKSLDGVLLRVVRAEGGSVRSLDTLRERERGLGVLAESALINSSSIDTCSKKWMSVSC